MQPTIEQLQEIEAFRIKHKLQGIAIIGIDEKGEDIMVLKNGDHPAINLVLRAIVSALDNSRNARFDSKGEVIVKKPKQS